MTFQVPTIQQRGQIARAMNEAHQHKPAAGEHTGTMKCTRCGSTLRFTIASNGISRGSCNAACGVTWCQ
jgi:hypothetical protein